MPCPLMTEISPSECNSGTTQKLPSGVHIMIEIQDVTTTLDKTGRLVISNIRRQMPLLKDFNCYILELNCKY